MMRTLRRLRLFIAFLRDAGLRYTVRSAWRAAGRHA
jgi:hypothetical protein